MIPRRRISHELQSSRQAVNLASTKIRTRVLYLRNCTPWALSLPKSIFPHLDDTGPTLNLLLISPVTNISTDTQPDLKTRDLLWTLARVPRCHCPWVCEEHWPWFWDDSISESPQPALPGLPPRVLGEVTWTGRQKTRWKYACERP